MSGVSLDIPIGVYRCSSVANRNEEGMMSDEMVPKAKTAEAPVGAPVREKRERRGPGEGGGRFRRPSRKPCRFCAEKVSKIDYKDSNRLRAFVTDRGKILPRRMTGTCSRHQRELTQAIKRARNIALLPFMLK
jgi:small subunit ribosomal protein S18